MWVKHVLFDPVEISFLAAGPDEQREVEPVAVTGQVAIGRRASPDNSPSVRGVVRLVLHLIKKHFQPELDVLDLLELQLSGQVLDIDPLDQTLQRVIGPLVDVEHLSVAALV